MSTKRLVRLIVVLGSLLILGNACHQVHDAPKTATTSLSCSAPANSTESLGGPLQTPNHAATFGMVYQRPGVLQDAYEIQLINTGNTSVMICSVRLVAETGIPNLHFAGAFVAPSSSPLRIVSAGRQQRLLQPADGYSLAPTPDEAAAPILVLRIGPANSGKPSRNNAVNIEYSTADGARYVAGYAVRFMFPAS